MADTGNLTDDPAAAPLGGRRLYHPGHIAAYCIIANLPTGCILYGLNLRRRGERIAGSITLIVGTILAIGLVGLTIIDTVPYLIRLISILGAIGLYGIEKRPYANAIALGAVRARWWPPALFVVAALIGVLLLMFAMQGAA